jgi:hypothetical protein
MKENSDLLQEYVSDMLTVGKHTLDSIERQTRDDRVRHFRDAYELLMKIETTLTRQTLDLEQYLATIDGTTTGPLLKKAAATAMGAMSGFYSRMRPGEPVSRNLRDDYTGLNLAAISYTMLHTTASVLGDAKLADLTLHHLEELTPLIVTLSRLIPYVVTRELAEEGSSVSHSAAAEEAELKTQRAWSRETIGPHI